VRDVITGKGRETAAAAAAAAAAEAEAATPPEPVIEPSETIYMQIVDFLLDTKATPVKRSFIRLMVVDHNFTVLD